jgi:cardiolipin synthase (CMP-forming)
VGFLRRIPFNIPNVLTLIRFALIPPVTILIYFDKMIPALTIYFIACVTDLLDGYIARKHHLVTNEGALLDPLADKLMSIFTVISFTVTGVLPALILIIVFIKELLMISGGIFLYFRNIVAPANKFGKTAAFTFNTAVGLTFLNELSFVKPWYVYFMYFALAMLIVSLAQYAYFNMYKKLKERKEN